SPVITKFFSNKIESSLPEWGDYLLEVADIFSTFDGEELDCDLLENRFSVISGRSPYVVRNVTNFRDEFGAYGTYLGLYHVETENDKWKIYLSNAAKRFLCSTEPDVESFCRTQLALFQYPNGAGAIQHANGSASMQANIRDVTIREIKSNIRINPFRLICKLAQIYHEYEGTALDAIELPYETIFMLMNDSTINTRFSPDNEDIYAAFTGYKTGNLPSWASLKKNIANFKRNFHIFDRTGMFRHTKNGLHEVKSNNTKNALSQIRKTVAQLYEYRYRSDRLEAMLCIVLQQKPLQDWVIDYLVKDRDIMICWIVDDFRFECPPECFDRLLPTGIVQ
ncbi:MAG: hypothetical protein LBH43_11490, partial [Treponema sp.]|nr:hypothetical protein [Treponema sp.]